MLFFQVTVQMTNVVILRFLKQIFILVLGTCSALVFSSAEVLSFRSICESATQLHFGDQWCLRSYLNFVAFSLTYQTIVNRLYPSYTTDILKCLILATWTLLSVNLRNSQLSLLYLSVHRRLVPFLNYLLSN